jgi:hypothetical protein
MPELAEQLRGFVDGSCPPLTVDEIATRVADPDAVATFWPRRNRRRGVAWRVGSLAAAVVLVLALGVAGLVALRSRTDGSSPTRVTVAGTNAAQPKPQPNAHPRPSITPVPPFELASGNPSAMTNLGCGGSTCFVSTAYGSGGDSTSGATYVSRDSGRTWQPSPLPDAVALVAPVSCVDDTWCAVGAGKRDTTMGDPAAGKAARVPELLVTADRGATWTEHAVPVPPDVQDLPAINGLPAETTYWPAAVDDVQCSGVGVCNVLAHVLDSSVGNGGLVPDKMIFLRTTDAGATWSQTVVPRQGAEASDEVGGFARSASMSCPTSSTCIAATAFVAHRAVAVFRTEDGGASWTEHHIARAMNLYAGVSCPDARRCWAATDGGVMRSTDGGATWSEVEPVAQGSVHGTQWNSVSCVSASTCYVGGDGISVTQDGGASWQAVRLPPGVRSVQSVACEHGGSCVALARRATDPAIDNTSSVVLTDAPSAR